MRGVAILLLVSGCGFRIEGGGVTTDSGTDSNLDGPVIDGSVDSLDGMIPSCPAGYGPVNGVGSYRPVESADKAWIDAADDCNDDDDNGTFLLHTHLVVLSSESERTMFSTASSVSGNTWVGLSDRATEGSYVWVTNEPTGGYPVVGQQPPWDTDDPDNAGGGEDCVRFKNSFVLEDKPCGDTESYVCECDAFAPN